MNLSRIATTRITGWKTWRDRSRTHAPATRPALWSRRDGGSTTGRARENRQLAALLPLEVPIRGERARADRFGTHFCVVTFTDGQQDGRGKPAVDYVACIILDALTGRIRATDVIGRAAPNGIGAVLPQTSPDGATVFALDIVAAVHARGHDISYHIYSHSSAGGSPEGSSPIPTPDPEPRRTTASTSTSDGDHAARGRALDCCDVAPITELLVGVSPPLWKRLLDVLGSVLGLLCLSPLFIALAVYIKAVSPGPVFFRQSRIGLRGATFQIWKLRTMHVNADTSVHQQHVLAMIAGEGSTDKPMEKLDGADPRIIRGGLLLRHSSIDELPQLINVLLGDMSLVGPRPEMPYAFAAYLPWHTRRFEVLHGMTGLWQVSGKNRMTFREMIRLDIRYGRALSPLRDAAILARTVPVVIRASNGTAAAGVLPTTISFTLSEDMSPSSRTSGNGVVLNLQSDAPGNGAITALSQDPVDRTPRPRDIT
ncbi:MAG: sugar transferase [Gemmatimonadaceae bacterium]